MINIILDCERMKYVNSGLFHYCLNVGKHLQHYIEPSQEQLSFFYPSHLPEHFGKANYLRQSSLKKFFLPSLRKYDIWHGTYQNSQYMPKRNGNIRTVLSIHDLNFLYQDKPANKKTKYLRHLQSNIDRADVIICISEFCKKDVLTHCNVGIKPIHVIYNGTNSLVSPELLQHSYKPRRPFLFSLGVICRKKNIHTLLPLMERNKQLELLIAGRPDDSAYMNYIHDTARELNIEDNVRVLCDITESEKSWYYRNCYAFVMPSLAEGFGLPVVEAMSVGKPVFLSRNTALPEIGRDSAFYFEDFNAERMHSVFLNGMRQYRDNNMETSIRDHSNNFCWHKTAKEYLEIYRSLK